MCFTMSVLWMVLGLLSAVSSVPLDLDVIDDDLGTWCAPENEARQQESMVPNTDHADIIRWADAALKVIRSQAHDTNAANSVENNTDSIPSSTATANPIPSEMTLYLAAPGTHRLSAVLPDGALTRSGAHSGWLALDPTPGAAFGHTIYVFAIDEQIPDARCISIGGSPLGKAQCLTQVFKNRCPNYMSRRSASWRRKGSATKRCDIDFLPLVHPAHSTPHQSDQRLLCRNDIAGFAACPVLRSKNETAELICDPLSTNTKRCDTTHELVRTRCRLFETCDQAVLLSGGWNRQLSGEGPLQNILAMYKMLRHNGFAKHNIKIFFANGVRSGKDDSESEFDMSSPRSGPLPPMYPTALKLALRYHIRTLCGTPHCVDSLVIYMNSPTRSDGATLLWDADGNGEYDETEVYTIREFLRDTQDCSAKQVVVLADQNYSGMISDAMIRSQRHNNVIVASSGSSTEYSYNSEMTHHWSTYHHSHACLNRVFEESLPRIVASHPALHDGFNGTQSVNIFGAPCDVLPPFTHQELKAHFMGCQYVPTKIWLSKHSSHTDPPPRLLVG